MPSSNGTVPEIFRLGDLSPLTKKVVLERPIGPNGELEDVLLDAWVEKRCTGRVRVNVQAALDRFRDVIHDPDSTLAQQKISMFEYLRDTAIAVVQGIEHTEAEMLAGDPDKLHAMLVYLGWEDESTSVEEESPEASGEENRLTGEVSSPNSPQLITSDQTSS